MTKPFELAMAITQHPSGYYELAATFDVSDPTTHATNIYVGIPTMAEVLEKIAMLIKDKQHQLHQETISRIADQPTKGNA